MAIHSTKHYNEFKENFRTKLLSSNSESRVNKFMDWFSHVYDRKQRVYFEKKLIWSIADIYFGTKKNNSEYWLAAVGQGGTGKSTILKQVLWTLDPTFNYTRICEDIDKFMDVLDKAEHYQSVLLDEPDEELQVLSKKGKLVKSILGKIRQKNLFVGLCATEMTSLPSMMYNKLNGIFFMPVIPRFYFFRNDPKKWYYPVNTIRKDYKVYGYYVFRRMLKGFHTRGVFSKVVPLSKSEEKKYNEEKWKDLDDNFEKLKKELYLEDKRIKPMIKMHEEGMTSKTIGGYFGLTPSAVRKIMKKVKDMGGIKD